MLLFSRLALAFYACPSAEQPTVAMAQVSAVDCAAAGDYSKMIDGAQPALCAQHLADEQQNTAAAQPPVSEPVFFVAYVLPPVLVALASQTTDVAIAETPPDPQGSGTTLFLQTRRLRI